MGVRGQTSSAVILSAWDMSSCLMLRTGGRGQIRLLWRRHGPDLEGWPRGSPVTGPRGGTGLLRGGCAPPSIPPAHRAGASWEPGSG